MRFITLSSCILLLALAPFIAAIAQTASVGTKAVLYGLYLGQTEEQITRLIRDAACEQSSSDDKYRSCTGNLLTPSGIRLDVAAEFKADMADELTLRAENEDDCRQLTSEINSQFGRPKAEKRMTYLDLPIDLRIWSDHKMTGLSTWMIVSMCSPDGPGRAILATSQKALKNLR